jgi:hypothetical protein
MAEAWPGGQFADRGLKAAAGSTGGSGVAVEECDHAAERNDGGIDDGAQVLLGRELGALRHAADASLPPAAISRSGLKLLLARLPYASGEGRLACRECLMRA